MAPKHSAKMLTSVPKHQKTVMHLLEKMCLLCKLPSGMSFSAIHCEFNVNGQTYIYIYYIRCSKREILVKWITF